jgi:hypothetical protein
MGTEGSFPCSQELATGSYSEPDESSSQYSSKMDMNIVVKPTSKYFKSSLSSIISNQNLVCTFWFLPSVVGWRHCRTMLFRARHSWPLVREIIKWRPDWSSFYKASVSSVLQSALHSTLARQQVLFLHKFFDIRISSVTKSVCVVAIPWTKNRARFLYH